MRKTLGIFLLFVISNNIWGQHFYEDIKQLPLKDLLPKIEQNHDIAFSYKDENINQYKIDLTKGNYKVEEILKIVFDQTKLFYEILDSKNIILTYNQNSIVQVCGYLRDKSTQESIIGATIFTADFKNSTVTDKDGYFEFSISIKVDGYTVSYLGYEQLYIKITKTKPCSTIELSPATMALNEIVLIEYLSDGISQPNDESTIVIEPDKMNILPGSVDKDIMTTIQFLPGISSSIESFDDINVRGGTPDQNLILWDHIPIYQTSHFFGNISAFNPFAIDHVDVYRSVIGSQFGGRVSSVIDITSKKNIPKKFKLGAGFNLTHSHLEMEIPLWKNSGIWFSTRRSITDLYNTPTFLSYAEKVFQGTKVADVKFNNKNNDRFLFNDANLKWMWKIGTNTFQISTIGGLNSLNFNSDLPQINVQTTDNLNIGSGGISFKWSKYINKNLHAEFINTSSTYRNDYKLTTSLLDTALTLPYYIKTSNKLTDGGSKLNFKYILNESQKVNFGYQFSKQNIDYTARFQDVESTVSEDIYDFNSTSHILYGEYELEIPNMLKLDLGLRYLRNSELQKDYFEPRISATSKITEHLKLKVGTSKHFQFINQLVILNSNNIGINNKIWVASDNTIIPVTESNQWMGGLLYSKNGWTIDVEGYVKELVGITSLSSDLESQPFSTGSSRIRGLDFLIKKKFKTFRSWLSYTVSESLYEFPEITTLPFNTSNDQTHNIQWVNLLEHKKWEFSLGVQLRTGLPYTNALGVESRINQEGRENFIIKYGDINGNRLKAYFRLDASIIHNFEIKGFLSGYIGFSIQNGTNYPNIHSQKFILPDNSSGMESDIIIIKGNGLRLTPNLTANFRF